MSELRDKVEVIERWVAGGATEYSVDGGKVWWTKEQWEAMQAYISKNYIKKSDVLEAIGDVEMRNTIQYLPESVFDKDVFKAIKQTLKLEKGTEE